MFSGYQLFCERQGRVYETAGGVTSYWPEAKSVTAATLFDIGSLTKVVATMTLLAQEVACGALDLATTLGEECEVLTQTPYAKLQWKELLSHCAGLIDWYPIYQDLKEQKLIDYYVAHAKSFCIAKPRTKTRYSDIGFLLLGIILEQRLGPIELAFKKGVVTPLGLSETKYGPLSPSEEVSATEYSLLRKRLLSGEVFDENCFTLGSKCAHAGLFSTARDLAKFARVWLDAVKGNSHWLDQEVARLFTSPAGLVEGSPWRLGWDGKSPEFSSCGQYFSAESFGHLGFPGCSIWIDPKAEAFVIFLCNRIHPSRFDERIKRFRPRLHDALASEWSS